MWNLGPGYLQNEVLVEKIKEMKADMAKLEELIKDFEEDLVFRLEDENVKKMKRVEDEYDLDTTVLVNRKKSKKE